MEDKMTIHRALSELKLIDAKIEKQINEFQPVGITRKDKLVDNHMKPEDFNKAAQSKYDSIKDLLDRKIKIKSAIVAANGTTEVTIGGKKMFIADAINFKQSIKLQKQLAMRMRAQYNGALAVKNRENATMEQNIQRILEATFGKDVKVDPKDAEGIRIPYTEANEYALVDPIEVLKKVEELDKTVEAFEAEVDAVLSEINAITFINLN